MLIFISKILLSFFALLSIYFSFLFNKPYLFFLSLFFLITFLIYKKSYFINLNIIFFSIIISLFSIDFIFTSKKNANVNIIPPLSSFWENKEIGYVNQDGNYRVEYYFEENFLFSNDYKIFNNTRVKNLHNIINCNRVILIGGSHNFGAGLNFDETLQGYFDLDFSTINFSTAGYGLNHSIYRIVDDIRNKNLIIKNCKKEQKFIFIYRYMFNNGHIFRNLGLHSYQSNGPDFTEDRLNKYILELDNYKNINVRTYCSDFFGCLKYNYNYFIYRFSLMFSYSNSFFFNSLSNFFYNSLILNKKNLNHTVQMIQLLERLIKNNFPNSELIVYIENLNFTDIKNKTYFTKNAYENKFSNNLYEILKKKNINLIKTSELNLNLCERLYIKFEGHPNKCHNKILYEKMTELLKQISFRNNFVFK